MAKQISDSTMWICVLLTYAADILLYHFGVPYLEHFFDTFPSFLIFCAVMLLLYLKPAVSYHVRPPMWLCGVVILPAYVIIYDMYERSSLKPDFSNVSVLIFCVAVPILFWILGTVIHSIQVKRWRQGK